MDDLTKRWKELSLFEVEGNKVDLSKKRKTGEHVVATKSLTRRNINVEVVACTFRPLWRTRANFEVNDIGNNMVLFDFELNVDAEKVLMGEPWTFDGHLVVMERYDGSNSVQNLQFNTTSFWVQIHGLPFSFMTTEVSLSIGETLGAVSIPKDTSELRGGNFMHIRVVVDITKPLCRGRCVTWDKDSEGWVSFKYKRLPNICYWCGQLCHDDKDCVMWLQSKGTLVADERQFGLWIRAAQYNPSRKTVVEVQGYDESRNKNHASQVWSRQYQVHRHGMPQ